MTTTPGPLAHRKGSVQSRRAALKAAALAGIAVAAAPARDAMGRQDVAFGGPVVDLRTLVSDATGAFDVTAELRAVLDAALEGSTIYNPGGSVLNLTGPINVTRRLRFSGPGEYRFTAGIEGEDGFSVLADGCVFEGCFITNPNGLGSQTAPWGSSAIRAHASDFRAVGNTIVNWQSGIRVAAEGEYHDIVIAHNRVRDIFGAGNGASDTTSMVGEDRGDGIVVWGAAATIVGNVVSARPDSDPRIGIHVEGLADMEEVPWVHGDAMVSITGNVVYGPFRRGIVNEGLRHVVIANNAIADSTWWSVALIEASNCTVTDNVIEWTRTSSDQQGQAWSPLRAPIATYNEVSHCRFDGNMIELVPGSEARAAIIVNGDPEPPEITTRISITDNNIHDLAGTCDIAGIYVAGASGQGLTIAGNRLEGIASDGIHVMTGDDVDLRDNRVTGVGSDDTTAVRIGEGSRSRVLGNICQGFGRGILVSGHASPTVVLNDIDDCATGIDLYNDTTPMVALNRIGEDVSTRFAHADGVMPTYAVDNQREARAYDVNSVSIEDLSAVLGTLLSDLRAVGIVR